jgi:hypothetical protein
LVKSLGPDAVFDYRDPECAQKILDYAESHFTTFWNTVATDESVKICTDFGSDGVRYNVLLPVQLSRSDVRSGFSNATTSIGGVFEYGPQHMTIRVMPEEFDFVVRWTGAVEKLWAEAKMRSPAVQVEGNRLDGLLDGLQMLRERKISARKLVYRVAE